MNQTYFSLTVSGQKGPVYLKASVYVGRIDAEAGLFLNPQAVRACIAAVPDVSRIYCESQTDPVGDEETRFLLCESAEQAGSAGKAGALTLITFAPKPAETFQRETVDGPWWQAAVCALKALPECAEALRCAAKRAPA